MAAWSVWQQLVADLPALLHQKQFARQFSLAQVDGSPGGGPGSGGAVQDRCRGNAQVPHRQERELYSAGEQSSMCERRL